MTDAEFQEKYRNLSGAKRASLAKGMCRWRKARKAGTLPADKAAQLAQYERVVTPNKPRAAEEPPVLVSIGVKPTNGDAAKKEIRPWGQYMPQPMPADAAVSYKVPTETLTSAPQFRLADLPPVAVPSEAPPTDDDPPGGKSVPDEDHADDRPISDDEGMPLEPLDEDAASARAAAPAAQPETHQPIVVIDVKGVPAKFTAWVKSMMAFCTANGFPALPDELSDILILPMADAAMKIVIQQATVASALSSPWTPFIGIGVPVAYCLGVKTWVHFDKKASAAAPTNRPAKGWSQPQPITPAKSPGEARDPAPVAGSVDAPPPPAPARDEEAHGRIGR